MFKSFGTKIIGLMAVLVLAVGGLALYSTSGATPTASARQATEQQNSPVKLPKGVSHHMNHVVYIRNKQARANKLYRAGERLSYRSSERSYRSVEPSSPVQRRQTCRTETRYGSDPATGNMSIKEFKVRVCYSK